MLERVTATAFRGATTNGRTQPLLLECEKADGTTVDVIAKFSANCDQQVTNLAREVIAACLAADLGLPVPPPFLVEISPAFCAIIDDVPRRSKIEASSPVAFGSTHVTGQYATWVTGTRISDTLLPVATAIFTFDAITQNPDRRDGNANLLVRGDEVRIIDHELCFAHDLIISWRPPWQPGALNGLKTNGQHIFRAGLVGRMPDFWGIRAKWAGLSDVRLQAYEQAVPPEWAAAAASVQAALKLIRDARDNIDGCTNEIKRVLT